MSKPSRAVAVGAPAEPHDGRPERAVVDVDAAPPPDRQRVEAERVPVQQMGLDHGREQVVGRADRVDVAREVEVQVLHRHDLGVATTGGAALDPEDRPERGLAQAEHRPATDVPEPLCERDRCHRLSLTCLGRRDRGDVDQLAVLHVPQALEHREIDLRLRAPVRLHLVRKQPGRCRDLLDRAQRGGLGDLEARWSAVVM